MRQIGRELGVRYLLEGSVRRAGERVRVTAQLIEADSGNHIWAERYDRPVTDIFAVQDEITINVAGAISSEVCTADIRNTALRSAEGARILGAPNEGPLASLSCHPRGHH
ncbi:hypothetical protein RUM8411_04352 [Ruegeria meonggei]|uniref:Uncharacterized protein n=1 Tax=Ruegeria meonggei TaxID=1446476 RepID=A0A1X7AD38_9RHOB|nr:hypothetical protein RUM8411_04352 [Ruegeria meonggei]